MRHTIIPFLLNALLSAVIGFIVGLVLLFSYPLNSPFQLLSTSSLTGAIIGTASRLSAILMYRIGVKNPIWGYVATFLITLAGCLLLSLGATVNIKFTVLVIAEPLALLTAFFNISYACRLNKGLKRKQDLLKQK